MKHQIVGIISLAIVAFLPLTAQAGLILSIDYEDGTFGDVSKTSAATTTGYSSLCCTHSAQIVNSPVRSGNKAVKMTLLPTDEGYQYGSYKDPYVRAEFEKWKVAHIGSIRWYAFSANVDRSYVDTSTDPNGTIIFQWHTNKDGCDALKGPHLSINITRTLEWRVRAQSDANPCTTNTASGRRDWNLGSVAKGIWVDFVIYAKWSYNSDGVLKIWKDGKLVIEQYGPNTFNDQDVQFVKWGIYKSWWGGSAAPTNDRLVVHFDRVRVGDDSSTYNDVAPPFPSSVVAPTNLQVLVTEGP